MVSSQPGAFTRSQDGQGMGAIIIVHPGGSWDIADAGHPASAGDAVEIYCTGLGDVTPRAVAGYPATVSPLLWVIDPVTLTIGGVKVPVSFAGLTPGLTGLYQVNATIPAGIAPSQQVPLVLSQGGRPATSITIPIQ
jgi:uncharacterized protein (TIGR03437 family)